MKDRRAAHAGIGYRETVSLFIGNAELSLSRACAVLYGASVIHGNRLCMRSDHTAMLAAL